MKTKLLVATLALTPLAMTAQDRLTGKAFATRSEAIASNGMAARVPGLGTLHGGSSRSPGARPIVPYSPCGV